jgi:hypothetical protein
MLRETYTSNTIAGIRRLISVIIHKRVIQEDKDIVNCINKDAFLLKKLFEIVGKFDQFDVVKSYWYKIEFIYSPSQCRHCLDLAVFPQPQLVCK